VCVTQVVAANTIMRLHSFVAGGMTWHGQPRAFGESLFDAPGLMKFNSVPYEEHDLQ
jgi:hypothetical protein